MSPSSGPRSRRDRESERQRAHELALQEAYARAARRRAMVGIGVVAAVIVAVVVAVVMVGRDNETKQSTVTTVAGATTSTTEASAPTVPLPVVTPGEARTGETPCPATDGSSPRITLFGAPPPMCIDPAKEYTAYITTTEGRMEVDLYGEQYPQAVNSFVFLAGYHYYDGLPISRIVPQAYAVVGNPTTDGRQGPGYSIPNEATAKPPLASPLIVALVPNSDGTVGGSFLFGLAAQFTEVPENAPQIGQVLDARVDPNQKEPDPTVQQAVNRAATPSGGPSKVITITSVTVHERT